MSTSRGLTVGDRLLRLFELDAFVLQCYTPGMNSKSGFRELIAVRFNEQELKRLREAAAEQGIGASTLVRILVNQALKPLSTGTRRMTSDEFRDVIASTLARLDKDKANNLLKDVSIGNPYDPMLLVWAGQTHKWGEFTSLFLKALLASLGVEVNLPENERLLEVKGKQNIELESEAINAGVINTGRGSEVK